MVYLKIPTPYATHLLNITGSHRRFYRIIPFLVIKNRT